MELRIDEVEAGTEAYAAIVRVAEQLDQAQYIFVQPQHVEATILLGAFDGARCVGFLRCLLQVIGREEGRPPIMVDGRALIEGYVEAFGVVPAYRRRGIGEQLQIRAAERCSDYGCYQMRSRSPITSVENYALKLKLGYAIQPSHENDSYYFLKVLKADAD